MSMVNGKSQIDIAIEAEQSAKLMNDYTASTPRHIPVDLVNAKPCPYCGSTDLRIVPWSDDTGDYDAIECNACLGCAPANKWNNRSTHAHAALKIGDILAGG